MCDQEPWAFDVLDLVNGGREARVSTEGLFRVVALPGGRVVQELIIGDGAACDVGARQMEREHDSAEWYVAVAYPLLAALERAGISLEAATVKPSLANCCSFCQSPRVEFASEIGEFLGPKWAKWACGASMNRNGKDKKKSIRTDACRAAELDYRRRCEAANAIVTAALDRAGIASELVNTKKFYSDLIDGREGLAVSLVAANQEPVAASSAA